MSILMPMRLLGLLAGIVTAACGLPNRKPLNVAVRTLEDTVTFFQSPQQSSFAVTAIARNHDSRPLYIALCGMTAQRDIGGTWTTVFTPACMSNGLTPLAPGDSVVVPVSVFGYSGLNRMPRLDPRMVPGRYRVLFGVFSGDPEREPHSTIGEARASNAFGVK
jgi:hypothetical protein